MNMNGCQGGAGPFTYLGCWSVCGGIILQPLRHASITRSVSCRMLKRTPA